MQSIWFFLRAIEGAILSYLCESDSVIIGLIEHKIWQTVISEKGMKNDLTGHMDLERRLTIKTLILSDN